MDGGGSQNSTVRNVTEVDPVTQQWRQTLMNQGGQLYNQGAAAYYPGNTVTPFSNQTQSGLDYLQGYAQNGATNLGQAYDANSRALSGYNPAMPFAQNAAQGGLSNNPAMSQLSQYGTGNNQYAQGMFQNAANDIGNAVNAQFASSGRYGGNAARTDTMTRGVGNAWNQIMTPVYEAERNRGLTAAQTMGGLYDSGANRQLAGAELMGGLYSQGNQDAAQAQAMLPGLYSYGMMPGQSMMDVGGIYEGQAQNMINADMDRYNYNSNAQWDNLQRYAQLMSGLPDFSSTTQTSTQPGPNRLMQGLGAASSIASLFAAFSDRRLKRDIEHVWTDANGLRWYEFNYHWDEPNTARRFGVMADEAPAHAVLEHPSGYKMVRYDLLGVA